MSLASAPVPSNRSAQPSLRYGGENKSTKGRKAAKRVLRSYQRGDQERERLILENLPQVGIIARRIHEKLPTSVSLEDLVSTGIIGLIAAVDRFDPAHNVKLKTYAECKIRGAILDSLRNLDWAPRKQRKRYKQIQAAVAVAEQRLLRAPTEEEIARTLNLTIPEYHHWLADIPGMNLHSLQTSFACGEARNPLDYIAGDDEQWPSRQLEQSERRRWLTETIERMPSTERTVINLYYREEMTLREIARIVNLHESRVSQLKSQAILRLRSAMQEDWPLKRGA